ncbi:hypothetical protein ACFL7D_06855 [candidate division KSB1 bacterium]
MRWILILLIVLIIITGCSVEAKEQGQIPVINEAMQLKLSFGDDETGPSEFLLARPQSVDANNRGEIVVLDENKLKVFTPEGKPLKTVGRSGEGPNEFDRPVRMSISPDNTVYVRGYPFFSTLTSDFEFIEKRRFNNLSFYSDMLKQNGWLYAGLDKAMSFGDIRVFRIKGDMMISENEGKDHFVLAHIENGEMSVITDYISLFPSSLSFKTGENQSMGLGYHFEYMFDFFSIPAMTDKVVYCNTDEGRDMINNKMNYILHVYDINTKTEKTYSFPFDPVVMTDDFLDSEFRTDPWNDSEMVKYTVGFNKRMKQVAKKRKYFASLTRLVSDGKYVFAFTWQKGIDPVTGADLGSLAHVIDIESGELVSKSYFKTIPQIIKNGTAYKIVRQENEFPRIEVYKINPDVYGKDIN